LDVLEQVAWIPGSHVVPRRHVESNHGTISTIMQAGAGSVDEDGRRARKRRCHVQFAANGQVRRGTNAANTGKAITMMVSTIMMVRDMGLY
jgi:hypothetical protein